MEILLEDDPDERKTFDQGKQATSKCRAADLPLDKRCAGNALKDFDTCSAAVDAALARGEHALIHCKASLSRSVAFVLAYLMKSRGMTLLEACKLTKSKWDAVWPCDRFVQQLIEYETHLARPHRLSTRSLVGLSGINLAIGMAVAWICLRR